MKLDVKTQTRSLRERLERETNPVLRRNLSTVIRHIEGEVANNVDLTMTTLVQEPSIRSYYSSLVGRFEPKPGSGAPKSPQAGSYMAIEGRAAVRGMYDFVCDKRLVWGHLDVDLLVVDTHCIVQGGLFHVPTTAAGLQQLGRTIEDENALYLGIGRLIVVFPFDVKTGLLEREDIYVDPATFDGAEHRKINPDDYLPGYETTVDLPPL